MVYLDCPHCQIILGKTGEKTEHRILSLTEDSVVVECEECMKKRRGHIELWTYEEPTPGATTTPGGTCREVNSRRM